MFKPQYSCNCCGKLKGESNHWLALRKGSTATRIFPNLTITAFADAGPDDEHYCSQECLLKAVDRFVSDLFRQQSELYEQDSLVPLA